MLSVIIQEHNEPSAYISKMLNLIKTLPLKTEVILVSSDKFHSLANRVQNLNPGLDLSLIGDIHSCGEARNVGAAIAKYDNLVFLDCHVCFTPESMDRLLNTLNKHPNAVVAPAIQAGEFPQCVPSGGIAHGVAFRFHDRPWEWLWVPSSTTDHEFEVPLVCGCAYSMKKHTFNVLQHYGGFLHSSKGLGAEEEFGMRLWRVGHPVLVEPRAVFLHLFKGYDNHPSWDEHSTAGFYESRVAAVYINVFNQNLYDHIESLCKQHWGEEWDKNLSLAKRKYYWLRKRIEPFKDRIDETWFFRVD